MHLQCTMQQDMYKHQVEHTCSLCLQMHACQSQNAAARHKRQCGPCMAKQLRLPGTDLLAVRSNLCCRLHAQLVKCTHDGWRSICSMSCNNLNTLDRPQHRHVDGSAQVHALGKLVLRHTFWDLGMLLWLMYSQIAETGQAGPKPVSAGKSFRVKQAYSGLQEAHYSGIQLPAR